MVSDQTNVRLNPPLIRPFPSSSDFWSYQPQTKVASDHTIPRPKWPLIIPSPRPKWPLIIPSPDRSDLWSFHPQTEVTSDHTIVRWNQIPDPVILVWEHTMCVGLGLIRGHFRMAPQPGLKLGTMNFEKNGHWLKTAVVACKGHFFTFNERNHYWPSFVACLVYYCNCPWPEKIFTKMSLHRLLRSAEWLIERWFFILMAKFCDKNFIIKNLLS